MDKTELANMEERERNYWWHIGRRQVLRDFLKRHLPGGQWRILDVGCGTGINFGWLRGFGQVTGLDNADDALSYCRAKGAYHQLIKGDASDAPKGQFDLVTAFDVLEHVDDVSALTAWHSALKPGGHLLVTVPAYQWLFGAHDKALQHKRRYSSALLRTRLRQAGFHIKFISPFFFFTFPVVAVARLFGKFSRPRATYESASAQVGATPVLVGLSQVESGMISLGLGWPWGSSILAYAVKE